MAGESVTCPRCGAAFERRLVDGEFAGACPACLAGVAVAPTVPEAVVPLAPGDKIQGYEILDVLGRGGMGTVYKARQTSLQRPVAIKVLNPAMAKDVEFVRRFEREARVLASVNHPHVVGVHDFGRGSDLVAGDFLYLVMEYVDGRTLEDDLKARTKTLEELLRSFRDVAKGLEAIHAAGLVHRDLKPSNILIGADGRARVSDFGLAMHAETDQKLTQSGMLLGTPHYISPEQAQGKKVDGRADLYALGVMLFEAAAGRPPFQAPSATALLLKHVNEAPPPLYKLAPHAPRGLQELVRRLLAKNPAARPDGATAVARDLDQILAELKAAPPASRERVLASAPPAAKAAFPLKPVLAGAAGLVLLLVASLFLFGGKPTKQSSTFVPPAAQKPTKQSDTFVPPPVAQKPTKQSDSFVAPEPPPAPKPVVASEPPKPEPTNVPDSLVAPPKPQEPSAFDAAWKAAEERFAEARALYEDGRAREAVETLTQAGFKAEEALGKYRALVEVGGDAYAARAAEQAKAVQQFVKLLNETRLAMSKPATPAPAPPPASDATPAPAAVAAPVVPPPTAPAKRVPAPDAAAVREVEKQLQQIYGAELARKDPADMTLLARRLRTQAQDEKVDKVRYGLLRQAGDLAARAGEHGLAFEVADDLSRGFEIDGLDLKQDLLAKAPTPKAADAALALAGAWEDLARAAVDADAYDPALAALAKAETLARAAKDPQVVARIVEARKDGRFLKDEFAKVRPNGPPEIAGRFYALAKGDWARGLPLLASAKSPIGELAAKELAAPAGDALAEVGDGWWELAEKESQPLRKQRLQGHARDVYAAALPAAGGLARLRIEKRLDVLDSVGAGTVDLLALIRPERDAVHGSWRMEQGKLVAGQEWFARLQVPFVPPDEYDWRIVVERRASNEDFYLGVVTADAAVGVSLDAGKGSYTGFGDMTKRGEAVGRFTGGVLPLLKPVTVVVSVRRKQFSVTADGRKILTYAWKGDEGRSMLPAQWDILQKNVPFIGAHGTVFHVHQMQLVVVSGKGRLLRASTPSVPAPPAVEAKGAVLDVLSLIDPAVDAVHGAWTKSDEGLLTPRTEFARIQVPVIPPDEYDWTVVVERRAGTNSFNLGPVWKGRPFVLVMDGSGGGMDDIGGLDLVGGRGFMDNPTRFGGPVLLPNRETRIVVSVRETGVGVAIDGKPVVAWKGSPDQLEPIREWRMPRREALMIGCYATQFLVKSAVVTPVRGASRLLRAPAAAPAGSAVDLLALVDPAKDAVDGTWTRDASGLRSAAGEHVRLQLPYLPPDEYDLRVSLTRGSSADGLAFGLARGGAQWTVFVDKLPSEGGHTGLEKLDGGQHTLVRGMQVAAGESATFEFRVRKAGIAVLKNGAPLFQWQGATSRLSNFERWSVPDKRTLFLGHWQSEVTYTAVQLVPVSGGRGAPLKR
jgi:serine/threonine protein kinase